MSLSHWENRLIYLSKLLAINYTIRIATIRRAIIAIKCYYEFLYKRHVIEI